MQDNNINCTLNIPYPKICESCLNRYDAQMIIKLSSGELAAINNYILQSLILADTYPDIAAMLECISITEMRHYKMYGRLLTLSGIDTLYNPREIAANFRKPKCKCTNDSNDIVGILEFNIANEKSTVSDMRLVMSQINDKSTAIVLKRILMDEEHHIDILTQLKHRYS